MAGKKSPLGSVHNPGRLFHVPEIVGKEYRPGRQPNAPGNSQMDIDYGVASVPWPRQVAPLNLFDHSSGIPQAPAVGIVNNQQAYLPFNNLYITGFAGKSKG